MSMTQGERLIAIETEIKEMKSDINKQGELIQEIHHMGKIQATQTEQIKTLCDCYKTQNERLNEIEARPSKRWDILVAALIATGVSMAIKFLG